MNYTDFNVELSPIDSIRNIGLKKISQYGEMASIYSCNCKWFEIFESKLDAEFVECGYFGEPCRSLDSLDKYYHNNFTVEEFVHIEYSSRFSGLGVNQSLHVEKLVKWFSDIAFENGFNPSNLTQMDCMRLNYVYRLKADTEMCNFLNQFYYSTPILSQRFFSEGILDVPYEAKVRAEWMLNLINSLCPELVSYPVFSHCILRRVNLNDLSLVTPLYKRIIDEFVYIGKK